MTKQEFIMLTGEDPEDMFGGDWENTLTDMGLDGDEDGTVFPEDEDEEDDDEQSEEEEI